MTGIEQALAAAVAASVAPMMEAIAADIRSIRDALVQGSTPAPRLTKSEIASIWKCSTRTIDNLRRHGLPTIMLGDSPRFILRECEAWLKENGNE